MKLSDTTTLMRRSATALLAIITLAAGCSEASLDDAVGEGHEASVAELTSYSGTLHEIYQDNFETGESSRWFELHDEQTSEVYRLDFNGTLDLSSLRGHVVSFLGRPAEGLENTLMVQGEMIQTIASPASPSEERSGTTENVIVIPIQEPGQPLDLQGWWTGSGSCNVGDVQDEWFDAADSTAALFNDLSAGGVTVQGTVVAPITMPLSRPCNFNGIAQNADQVYKFLNGANSLSGYNRRVYIVPNCFGWAGLAQVTSPGDFARSWIVESYACDRKVFSHELGHNLGLGHADSPNCNYCDGSDFMGSSPDVVHLNAPHTDYMGWLDSAEIESGALGGTFQLTSLDDMSSSGTKMVIVPTAGETLFVSMRTDDDWSAPLSSTYADKVSVHLMYGYRTELLTVLAPGSGSDTYVAPDGTSIELVSVSGGFADVVVSSNWNPTLNVPVGALTRVARRRVTGYAWDPNAPLQSLVVEVEIDGVIVDVEDANRRFGGWRNLFPAAGPFHKLRSTFPKPSQGSHLVEAFARDIDSTGTETGMRTLIGSGTITILR